MTEQHSPEQLEQYKRLIAISRDLASTLDLDILLKRIVRAAAELSGAEEASILLYDERSEQLYFQVATNFDPRLRGIEVPAENSIAGWIVKNRSPIIISDITQDERHFGKISEAIDLSIQSLLGVPLIAKDKVSGVLEAINKRAGEFTEEDQEALMTLGSHAAVAIENSRLFQQFDLIAEFVHELRTPLASLRTATHLLNHPKVTPEKRSQLSHSIQTETQRLSELSTSFLDIARLESGRTSFDIAAFNLKSMLHECTHLVYEQAAESGLQCNINIPDDLPTIEGDCDKLKQAVVNLLSNAVKYNRPGGSIQLTAKAFADGVQIIIQDSGIGIPEKYIGQLFGKFFRVPGSETHAQGTGLGLSIVKRIIEGHGGKIGVESQVDQGTTFTLFIPVPISP